MARIPRANHATSPQYIFERKEFTCNNMSGRWTRSFTTSGDLSAEERALLAQHMDGGQNTYIVYSYVTPIAWWTEHHGWHKVDEHFSITTSKHQSRLHLIK